MLGSNKPAGQVGRLMLWKVVGVSLAGLLMTVVPASAGEGTLGLMAAEEWGTPLSDAEMEGIRGGFFGVSFGVYFSGYFDRFGQAAGNLFVNTSGPLTSPPTLGTAPPAGSSPPPPEAGAALPPPPPTGTLPLPVPQPTIRVEEGQVRIMTSLGNFNGASGIFQIAQVPGNFNVVHNQLFVQIAVVNVVGGSRIPNLASLFGRR